MPALGYKSPVRSCDKCRDKERSKSCTSRPAELPNPLTVGDNLLADTDKIMLHKARTWDDSLADGFATTALKDLFAGKIVVVFSVPAPFTGVCSNAYVPTFANNSAAMKEHGVDQLVCLAVTDHYAMNAWANILDTTGIDYYTDPSAAFTDLVGQRIDLAFAGVGPGERSQRYSMVVRDGTILALFAEAQPTDIDASNGQAVVDWLKENKDALLVAGGQG